MWFRHVLPSPAVPAVLLLTLLSATGLGQAQERARTDADASPAVLSDSEIERFLKTAKVVRTRGTKKGITGSTQATLSDGTLSHDAHIQTIDEQKREFRSARGVEFDFRDSWMFNVAAYKLDRLIGLNMVPVSVSGRYRSNRASVTWWIDDVLMDEGDRMKKKIEPPDRPAWSRQMQMMRLFDELIANTDRNVGNMIYTSDWRLWPIDHTRAFRKQTTLRNAGYVTRCDRSVFERLKALDRDTLKRELGDYLDDGHIKSLLARRDLIVKKLDELGPSALFDREANRQTSQDASDGRDGASPPQLRAH
jgi:hypothetical protein